MKSRLFIIVGPSGVGKNTLLEGLLASVSGLRPAVSVTTRSPRPGEIAGVHYYYISENLFKQYISSNSLLQYVNYAGNYYGLLKDEINSKLAVGDVVTVVEPEGVSQLKQIYRDAMSIYLDAPEGVLAARMSLRGDSKESVDKRMGTYSHFSEFKLKADYVIPDSTPADVLETAKQIITKHRDEEISIF